MRSSASSSAAPWGWAASCRKSRVSRPPSSLCRSAERDRVDLLCADEVVLAQSLDRVRRELHAAIVVAHLEVRMMVLDVGGVRERVDAAHRAVEILELELPPQVGPIVRQDPVAGEMLHEMLRLLARVGRHAAFARLAVLLSQLIHDRLLARSSSHGRPGRNLPFAEPASDICLQYLLKLLSDPIPLQGDRLLSVLID